MTIRASSNKFKLYRDNEQQEGAAILFMIPLKLRLSKFLYFRTLSSMQLERLLQYYTCPWPPERRYFSLDIWGTLLASRSPATGIARRSYHPLWIQCGCVRFFQLEKRKFDLLLCSGYAFWSEYDLWRRCTGDFLQYLYCRSSWLLGRNVGSCLLPIRQEGF